MRARDYAQTALLTVAAFLIGLMWGHNWWALAAGTFGIVLMALVCAAKHREIDAHYEGLLQDQRRECQQRVRDAVNEYHQRTSVVESLNEIVPDQVDLTVEKRRARPFPEEQLVCDGAYVEDGIAYQLEVGETYQPRDPQRNYPFTVAGFTPSPDGSCCMLQPQGGGICGFGIFLKRYIVPAVPGLTESSRQEDDNEQAEDSDD